MVGLFGCVMHILSVMLMLGFALSLQPALVSLERVMEGSFKGDVHSCSVLAVVKVSFCSGGFEPQLYADNLKCVSRDPALLLRAARFTTGYVRLVGQEPALLLGSASS